MDTTLLMVYKLLDRALKKWRRLRGHQLIVMVIEGVKFVDGTKLNKAA
jgi:putative transposase